MTPEPPTLDIAILEDQLLMREAITHLAETEGWNVCCSTESASSFLSQVGRAPPALALVDLYLGPPGQRSDAVGWQVVQSLRRWHPSVKVVVLSASEPDQGPRAAMSGAAAYVDKNAAGVESLVSTLRAVFQGERRFPCEAFGAAVSPPDRAQSPLDELTARELQTLRYVASGLDNLKIAAHLGITERTIRAHVSSLYRKLGSENRAQLALLARRLGVIPLGDS